MSIQRINVPDLESIVVIPIPAPDVLQVIGAFKLDIGENAANYPLQLAIPVQTGSSAQTEAQFCSFAKDNNVEQ